MPGSQIGLALARAREEAHLTQQEAVRRANASPLGREHGLKLHWQTLSKYERGAIMKVPTRLVEILAPVYGRSVSEIVSGEWPEVSENVSRGTTADSVPRTPDDAARRVRAVGKRIEADLLEQEGSEETDIDALRVALATEETVRMFLQDYVGRPTRDIVNTFLRYRGLAEALRLTFLDRIAARRKTEDSVADRGPVSLPDGVKLEVDYTKTAERPSTAKRKKSG